jgi:spectinomycin phosphotransferase
VRSRPAGLSDANLAIALEHGWEIAPVSMAYVPVGAGSHHWRVDDRRGRMWFVTVDELDVRREHHEETRADVFDRLTAAFSTAHALAQAGADFVVAPIAAFDDLVLHVADDQWAVAVFPLIDGETFRGGQALPMVDRLAVVEMVARLHTTPIPRAVRARADDHRLQNRADLEAAIVEADTHDEAGPYAAPLASLLTLHRALVDEMLAEYDDLVAVARQHGDRTVLTHGEPHAGNTMRATSGWKLIDWDTSLRAAPERDMWMLEPGDGVASAAYTAATGIELLADMLTLFRLRWDLSDLAADTARLRAPHGDTANEAQAWEGVSTVLRRRSAGDLVPPAAWR